MSVTIDRSCDGASVPVFPMHFDGLTTATDEGKPMIVLKFKTLEGLTPVGICRFCAAGLLSTLLEARRLSPEHFTEASDA